MSDRRLVAYEHDENAFGAKRLFAVDSRTATSINLPSFITVQSLPTTGSMDGEAAILASDNSVHVWIGGAWRNVGAMAPSVPFSQNPPANPVDGDLWFQIGASHKILHGLRVFSASANRWLNAEPDRSIEFGDHSLGTRLLLNDSYIYWIDAEDYAISTPIRERIFGQFTGGFSISNDPWSRPKVYDLMIKSDSGTYQRAGSGTRFIWDTDEDDWGDSFFEGTVTIYSIKAASQFLCVMDLIAYERFSGAGGRTNNIKLFYRTHSGTSSLYIGSRGNGTVHYLMLEGGLRYNSGTPQAGGV